MVGFMVTSPRYKPVHDNAYMKTYALLEEMGKPISFHAAYNWNDQSLAMTNRFISVHALGFMWFNMVHMTNWVINGMPERFPKLKVMWIESGLTWAYCLMQRLDHSYMMRTSDARRSSGSRASTCARCTTPRSRWRSRTTSRSWRRPSR